MKKKTYGAPGLVDWVAQIKAGAARVRVHFTGGALTSYGVTPAEYTTGDRFIQTLIERSNYYREGRITLVRETGEDDEDDGSTSAGGRARKGKVKVKSEDAPAPQKAFAEAQGDSKGEEEPSVTEEASEDGTASAAEGSEELKEVEVTCLQDAQAYLQEEYGIATWKVRSYELAQRAGADHGVRFKGAKFDTLGEGEDLRLPPQPGEGE